MKVNYFIFLEADGIYVDKPLISMLIYSLFKTVEKEDIDLRIYTNLTLEINKLGTYKKAFLMHQLTLPGLKGELKNILKGRQSNEPVIIITNLDELKTEANINNNSHYFNFADTVLGLNSNKIIEIIKGK